MAFILIQHLDPTHASMMPELLADHTSLTVRQATDGMPVERDHLYVIAPGSELSLRDGALRVSRPRTRHGTRLPFDVLLRSLAAECGFRSICVVLSGTGADGSLGLRAVKESGGLVFAQDPEEASFDGMPRSAIATGAVDRVLRAAEIAEALVARAPLPPAPKDSSSIDRLPEIVGLLREKTDSDFTAYKSGTLRRRIERRMAMASLEADDLAPYLERLRGDPTELDQLAKDLLIHVTGFFRDPAVFDFLADAIVPELVAEHMLDRPLRIWIPGCSTGEEAYSLAILFQERIAAAKSGIRLQVFASDVDPDAIATARDGLYPHAIEAEVSHRRLTRFFTREDGGYRVSSRLRADLVFTVQDVLTDPPFSRLDLISCRNLLIYLRPEAQSKVISLFHFALRDAGLLLLGGSETIGNDTGRFAPVPEAGRLYRRIGRDRTVVPIAVEGATRRAALRSEERGRAPPRQDVLAELCRNLVAEAYAPAAVLINRKRECLYSSGPTDRYLRVSPGRPTHDVLAMARPDVAAKLAIAIQKASREQARIVVGGVRDGPATPAFTIDVRPVSEAGEDLLLICFVDEPTRSVRPDGPIAPGDLPRVALLEQELAVTRRELRDAILEIESSSEEHDAINEEASSVNEEFQSTNEELLASKEELQSLNEELTALNGQLQETLDRQRTTSNDLQNVLFSTDVATLFLDTDLRIRFFTPATTALFNVIPSDVGRPLVDLHALAAGVALPADARAVLRTLAPIEREIEAAGGVWFLQRMLPYRTHDNGVEGVVVTFTDITERKHAARALEAARQEAELANVAKSRFLAAASHDLRQPLQTLVLLQGLLANAVEGNQAARLVALLDPTLGAMSGMLDALRDMNQIDAGIVPAEVVCFPVGELLERLGDEFGHHARAQGLALRVVHCGLLVRTDPRLLERMVRNLLSNALKYTSRGKVLLGCRRHGEGLRIEIWDTGVGIPDGAFDAIFEEYRQLDNAARERGRGLGLGLSIVQRLGRLLGHRVSVRSRLGHGSVFGIEVSPATRGTWPRSARTLLGDQAVGTPMQGTILVVDDDPEVCRLLDLVLTGEGHRVATAPDGVVALALVARSALQPDLILADFNLPNGMDGLRLTAKLRAQLQREIPAIILTGDISAETLCAVVEQRCVHLSKPVRSVAMARAIQQLLAAPPATPIAPPSEIAENGPPTIFVVDDDDQLRSALRAVLEAAGQTVEDYASGEAFLTGYRPRQAACLLVDAYLPGMNGLELLSRLGAAGHRLPAIMITGSSDVPMAVRAMKAGAMDFIEKPIGSVELLASIGRALEQSRDAGKLVAWRDAAASQVAGLTARQRQVMDLVLAGHPSKNIAADLGISQRTVENHRATIMRKTGSASLPALARLAVAAARDKVDAPSP